MDTFGVVEEGEIITHYILNGIKYNTIITINGTYEIDKFSSFKIMFDSEELVVACIENETPPLDSGIHSSFYYNVENPRMISVDGEIYNINWNKKYGFVDFCDALKNTLENREKSIKDIKLDFLHYGSNGMKFYYLFNIITEKLNYSEIFIKYQNIFKEINGEIMRILYTSDISEEVLLNEKRFTIEVLLPLFRYMKFINVKYNHGNREFGKDITFSEYDRFDIMKNYGVQVKIGNLSGRASSQLDLIISQIDDAFSISYIDENRKKDNTYLL